MVRWDVGKGIKKVSSQSPVSGRSYGRWRDRPEGRHGDIVELMRSSIVDRKLLTSHPNAQEERALHSKEGPRRDYIGLIWLKQSDDGDRSCLSSREGRSIFVCVRCDGGSGSRSKIKDTLF
jgi:hypothetical protein